MLDRLLTNLDVLPGKKTYVLSGVASSLLFLQLIGVVPKELYDMVLPWIIGTMAPSVVMKLAR